MSSVQERRPRFDAAEAEAFVRERYRMQVQARALPSERDQNFRLRGDAGCFVLKISRIDESNDLLAAQNDLLHRLASAPGRFAFSVPRVDIDGAEIGELEGPLGTHMVRLLSWVDGTALAEARPRPLELFREVGELMGTAAAALPDSEDRLVRDDLAWDLGRAGSLVSARVRRIADRDGRALVERATARFAAETVPRLQGLRRSVIQNDANDHNLIVGPVREHGSGWSRHVVGLIDVGDALESWTVAEAAVAAAYAMLDSGDPLAAAAAVVAGFHEVLPLQEAELAVLFELARMRLCLSVCNSAVQRGDEPDNDYLSVSEAPAWQLLRRLETVPGDLAHFILRQACGLEPCPAATGVRSWLAANAATFAPVVEPPLEPATTHVFDLGVGSTEMGGGEPGTFGTAELTERLFGLMRASGAVVGIGRYDEPRCWYGGELFETPGHEGIERRTVHVGIDIFLPAGAPVFAPLEGVVVGSQVNAGPLDYGPTLVLEHRPEPGVLFWTLYGHLGDDAVTGLAVGDRVSAGQRIASLGDFPGNGGWPPHLHFQVMADMLDKVGDFPGVAAPSQRAVWCSVCPDPNLILNMPESMLAAPHLDAAGIARVRRDHVGPNLSVSYRRPLEIVRGFGQYLYDRTGQPFLDGVNNVPHVGHSHPHVVAAVNLQNELLNTNTRYLHENLARYAQRLAATLPPPLEVCYFVCSGSEANELALRLARTRTGRRDMVVVDGGYHGHTSSLIDLSSYKHAGPGGQGAPDWVHVTMMPDEYRGPYRADDPERGSRYAAHVRDAFAAAAARGAEGRSGSGNGSGAAGLLVEPLIGCGGQLVPPPGYLAAAFRHAREAGGVCIADEVQIGFGRVGTHFWAFEAQGAVPDIVTLGKPIGNGFPLAAVVTTREIADAFANGMEFFSTFGGNPVACAAGLAVLDVLEQEDLQRNALLVGEHLLEGLRELMSRHPIVGDVRGVGLYVGAELVRDRESLEPAAEAASYVINRVRDLGALISTDGPLHNVLKIKPPMCFSRQDADALLDRIDRALGEDLPRRAGRG